MTQTAAGYARGGTDDQDHAARRQALAALDLPRYRLGGPTPSTSQRAHLTKLDAADEHSISKRAQVFSVSRPRACRVAARQESS
jgi:hypothetical protein